MFLFSKTYIYYCSVFPKTDYTYSRASQCRYEIAPGVLAMPNMSRRSIHSDCSSTHGSSKSNSHQSLNLETVEHRGGDIVDISSIKEDNMVCFFCFEYYFFFLLMIIIKLSLLDNQRLLHFYIFDNWKN